MSKKKKTSSDQMDIVSPFDHHASSAHAVIGVEMLSVAEVAPKREASPVNPVPLTLLTDKQYKALHAPEKFAYDRYERFKTMHLVGPAKYDTTYFQSYNDAYSRAVNLTKFGERPMIYACAYDANGMEYGCFLPNDIRQRVQRKEL